MYKRNNIILKKLACYCCYQFSLQGVQASPLDQTEVRKTNLEQTILTVCRFILRG